jgi:hypothetical protein
MMNKKNLQQTLDRMLAFVERRLEGGILAWVYAPSGKQADPSASDPGEVRQRECLLLEDLEGFFRRTASGLDLTDCLTDVIPRIYPTGNFGESVWSGMLGGNIIFAGNNVHTWSHCPKPVIPSIETFDFPEIKEDNFWFRKMLEVTQYFVDRLEPVCDVYPFIFDDCLNLLVELRGPVAAYTDLSDHPDFVEKFMDWSIQENIRVFETQTFLTREFVKKAFGGHPFYKYASCNMPSLSIDAYGLARPEVYEFFGLEHHRRIVNHFGGAGFHIHGNARRLCRMVSKIEKLTACYFGDDVGYPNAYEVMEELKEAIYPIPVMIEIPKEIFVEKLTKRTLPGDILYNVIGSFSSVTEANEIMRRVFDYHR